MSTPSSSSGIAIVGLACRFPGAKTPSALWKNLRDGVEAVKFLTSADLTAAGLDPGLLHYPAYVNACIRLEDVDLFEPGFFGFSPREAELLDPQQRLFLECAWEAFEDAGWVSEKYPGLVGVFGGVNASHYAFNLLAHPDIVRTMGMFAITLATDKDHLSTRVAYKLNLKGPAITVQTTCSTSLVAVCQACQSLLNYQCDLALAGGSSILLNQNGYVYEEGGIPSPDGHCRAFDAMAKGTVGGSGVGVVLLKRLDEALNDGDSIHAVIRGFAVNNDGSVKVGYTAPSIDGQAEVIATALRMGEIDPETISYLEAHGTGTPLGDPIEVAALTKAFREAGARSKQFCGIGSVKSNLGHCDPAAGVAGLIKTVLALENRMLPPTLHFHQPNPNIDFQNSPFYVNDRLQEWKRNGGPLRAGVSSFGIGGTNAHVIVEEAPERTASTQTRTWQFLALSARSNPALEGCARNLAAWLREHTEANLADVAYTLHVGRKHFPHRRAMLCRPGEMERAILQLDKPGETATVISAQSGSPPQVAFMFSGQGSQAINMGLELYRSEKIFREAVDSCAELLQPHLEVDLRTVLYPPEHLAESARQQLWQTAFTQPGLFTLEYALAQLWREWGVTPQAMVGHSIGEYVAACLAGVFTLEEGLALVAARGKLMQSLPAGGMLAVMLPESELLSLLPPELSLAAVNAPGICSVAGAFEAIECFETVLANRGTGTRRLHTSHAFHSPMIEPILEAFAEEMRRVHLRPPSKPFQSNLSGTWITSKQAVDPNYWVQQARHTVRFAANLRELLADPNTVLVEVGPGHTLQTLALQTAGQPADRLIAGSLPPSPDRRSETEVMLETLARLWVAGHEIDWRGFYAHERRLRVPLPTYPFQRQRFWIEPPKTAATPSAAPGQGIQRDISDWFYAPVWEQAASNGTDAHTELATQRLNWLILCDRVGLGHHLMTLLQQENQNVAMVEAGDEFIEVGPLTFQVRPEPVEDYTALLTRLQERQFLPDRILHLFAVQSEDHDQGDVEAEKAVGFYSLLALARAIAGKQITTPIHLGVVATQLQAVRPGERVVPARALVQGPCRVIPQEFPSLRCRSIDITGDLARPDSLDTAAHALVREMLIPRTEGSVAYRNGQRWVQRFRMRPLHRTWGPAARLRRHGVYLVTGGLGQIGLELAEYLGRTVQAKLVLLGRSDFPKREVWEASLASGVDERIGRKIRRLIELESLGAELLILQADVSDRVQMAAALQQVRSRFGAVHGLIHAAGTTGQRSTGAFIDATPDFCEEQFRPKLDGLLLLDEFLKEEPLDFVLLTSSLSAILGGIGFVAYASANAFLDAYAAAKNQGQFVPWTSVNWDGWGFGAAQPGEYLLPAEGVEAFARLMHRLPGQIAVSVKPLVARLKEWVQLEGIQQEPAAKPDSSIERHAERHARPALPNPYQAPTNAIEKQIVEVWETLLGIEPIGIRDNYFELGGHSLLAIQVSGRLRSLFQVKLPVQTLFEAPTVAELAEHIQHEQQQTTEEQARLSGLLARIEELSDEEVKALLESDDASALRRVTDADSSGNGSNTKATDL